MSDNVGKYILIGGTIGGVIALILNKRGDTVTYSTGGSQFGSKQNFGSGADYKPYSVKSKGGLARATQNRRHAYWKKALPVILNIFHGHRLALVNYSKSSDRTNVIRNIRKTGKPITVELDEIDDFMERKGKFLKAGTAAFNRGLVTMYAIFSNTGKDLRYINVDFDIADLPETDVRPYVMAAYMYFVNKGYIPMAVFTGSSWHLWAKKPDNGVICDYGGITADGGKPGGSVAILKDMSKAIGVQMRGASAHMAGKITIDYSTNVANKPIRVPLSLHQKTGLVAIPVSIENLFTFNPDVEAHPDNVLHNLDLYANIIRGYFTFLKWNNGEV